MSAVGHAAAAVDVAAITPASRLRVASWAYLKPCFGFFRQRCNCKCCSKTGGGVAYVVLLLVCAGWCCRNRKTGFPCPRGRGKATRFPDECKGRVSAVLCRQVRTFSTRSAAAVMPLCWLAVSKQEVNPFAPQQPLKSVLATISTFGDCMAGLHAVHAGDCCSPRSCWSAHALAMLANPDVLRHAARAGR